MEHYAELVRQLAAKRAGHCASPSWAARRTGAWARSSAKAGGARCLDLTGKLSLPEMVEWMRRSELLVTNDTGPMHVAAALGKPVVALFGPTTPRRTGPYRQLEHVLQLSLPCVPCLKSRCRYAKPLECLRALPPSAAVQAAMARLAPR